MKVAIIYNKDFSGVINKLGIQNKEIYNPKTIHRIAGFLENGGHNVKIIDGNMHVIESLTDFMPRVVDGEKMGMVFNLAYGIQGESRYTHLPAMLEMLGIPYVGSGPEGHALALDKVITKIILQKHNIPTPNFWVFSGSQDDMSDVEFPVIVKPKMEAVSFGLRVVYNHKDLGEAVDFIVQEFQQQALVEQFIRGREFCIGLLGNGNTQEAFPVLEIDLENDPNAIQSVEDKKYTPREKICPAVLDQASADAMILYSKAAFRALGLKDFARVDIRMDEIGNIYILEINSMASLGKTGSFVYSAGVAGYDYPSLVNKMLDVAAVRYFADSVSLGKEPEKDELKPKKQPLSVRIRGFLRSRQESTEKLLSEMVGINNYVKNVDGVNTLGMLVAKNLFPLGFQQNVIPQTENGNILLFSNTMKENYDVLLISSLDSKVPFKRQSLFKSSEHRLEGTGIWENKGGLAMLVASLQALKFTRLLKKINIGILLTTDDSLQGRYCKSYIEDISRKSKVVLGLSGGGSSSLVVTGRSGAALYKCHMHLNHAESAQDAPAAVKLFSLMAADFAGLTNEENGIIVSPKDIAINSNIGDKTASGEMTISVRFKTGLDAEKVDEKIRGVLKKRKVKNIGLHIDGGIRRPPMEENSRIEKLYELAQNVAETLDIRFGKEYRWSSSNICFSDCKRSILDGLGPVGAHIAADNEYILRHSLLERGALLAILMDKISKGKLDDSSRL